MSWCDDLSLQTLVFRLHLFHHCMKIRFVLVCYTMILTMCQLSMYHTSCAVTWYVCHHVLFMIAFVSFEAPLGCCFVFFRWLVYFHRGFSSICTEHRTHAITVLPYRIPQLTRKPKELNMKELPTRCAPHLRCKANVRKCTWCASAAWQLQFHMIP